MSNEILSWVNSTEPNPNEIPFLLKPIDFNKDGKISWLRYFELLKPFLETQEELKNEINSSYISLWAKKYIMEKLENYSKDNFLNLNDIKKIRELIKENIVEEDRLKNEINSSGISQSSKKLLVERLQRYLNHR